LSAISIDEEELSVEAYGEFLSIIDTFLARASNVSLISSNEIQDFCLDLRNVITKDMEKNNDDGRGI
jgi:hypothetical protein